MNSSIEDALKIYLEIYFSKRDLKSTLDIFSDSCSGYGTGLDEVSSSYQKLQELYTRDIEEVPSPINFQLIDLMSETFSDSSGYTACRVNLEMFIAEHKVKFNQMRLSIFWVVSEKKWKIKHMHISFPTDLHEDGEAYPIKELEEKNRVLKRVVKERTKELEEALDALTLLSITDKMTTLFNRYKTENYLEQEIERSKRYSSDLSIIMLDIDYFKRINDTYGHSVGDEALKEFATILSQRTRKNDIVGRWGGEEFLIISPSTNIEKVLLLAEDIRQTIEQHHFKTIDKLRSSLGVATHIEGDSVISLVDRADRALYKAKNSGRNRVSK